jgi:SsrA-binding protein
MPEPAAKSKDSRSGDLATNRRARHDYHILERFEAGLELHGPEVKSIRARDLSLQESFAKIEHGQVTLYNLHVNPYPYSSSFPEDPRRPRRLLLHRGEIKRLIGHIAQKGRTLIPLRVYLKRGLIKVELALCAGKLGEDKRETLRRQTADREAERAIARARKR